MKTHKARTFLRAVAVLAVAVTGGNLAQAQSCNVDWTGNTGTDAWSTAGNWSTNQVPGPTSDHVIETITKWSHCRIVVRIYTVPAR